MSETITINTYPIQETIDVTTVNDITTVNVNVVQSSGAVSSVNEMTGDVILTTANLSNDSGYITSSSLPTNVSDLTNDSGFITSIDIPTNVSAFTNDSGYITGADLPNVSGLVPYTGATTSLDLGVNRLEASQIITKTNEDAKRMTLSSTNVSSDHTAEWQDKDYSGIADISDVPTTTSQLTNNGSDGIHPFAEIRQIPEYTSQLTNDSGFVTDISGKVDKNADISGATKTKITYDSKGLVTGGADATTADIADSANKRYVTDANLTSIGTISSKLSGYLYKNTTSATVTGTTSETQVLQVTIPANTFSATDILKFEILALKSGTAGTQTIKVKLSTSATMPSGTTDQIAVTTPSNTNLFTPFYRSMLPISGGNIYGYPFTTSQVSDLANVATAVSSKAFDVTVTQYFYISITNTSSGDTSTLRSVKISNI